MNWMTFFIISLTTILVMIAWFVAASKSAGYQIGAIVNWWRASVNDSWKQAAKNGWFDSKSIGRLSYFASFDLVLILAVSALLQPWIFQHNMSGFLLLLHMTAAPLFAISFCLFAFYHSHFFGGTAIKNSPKGAIKLTYWFGVAIALLVIASSVTAMFPIAGSNEQWLLAAIHKYAALALIVIVFVQSYLVVRKKLKATPQKQKKQAA